ncbi:MAG: MaoC family dehydratase N-terminal domain-containing protein [Chloroflexi bacterium]|nr:MaoC family dehydratase N-terminal domain-containing protein [Chloroflexota bacterium]
MYDDYRLGMQDTTGTRTITEADAVNFCGLSGNYQRLYTDEEYARASGYGGRIAPDLLASTIIFGLIHRDSPTLLGNKTAGIRGGHLSDRLRFLAPVRPGDTIRCHWEIASMRESHTKPDRGIITFALQVLNQRDEVVQEGEVSFMRGKRTH